MTNVTPVILSGGSGTRLWPASRASYPKQFLKLTSEHSLLQQTLLRLNGFCDIDSPIVIANEEHRFLVAEQLRQIGVENARIILEPCGRNTAPAIALAALTISACRHSKEDQLLVLPADHTIVDVNNFHEALDRAKQESACGHLVTFGVVPDSPSSEFGYIAAGEYCSKGVHRVSHFLEKPDIETAASLIKDASYSWNSGMFMFSPDVYLKELELQNMEMYFACKESIDKSNRDLSFIRVDQSSFERCPSDSIDYAIMEKTEKAVVVSLDASWSDVGSWNALYAVTDKNEDGNVTLGDCLLESVKNSYFSSDQKLIVGIGVTDLAVVETDDTILVASLSQASNVKNIVALLNEKGRPETSLHRKVYRPWGSYDSIEQDDGFQVKRLTVKPAQKLSLQSHKHRAEHWVVVRGVAEVRNGEETLILNVNESTFIPIGARHSLSNPGEIDLEIIEVQSGSYLGEDDIERYEDIYGRHEN